MPHVTSSADTLSRDMSELNVSQESETMESESQGVWSEDASQDRLASQDASKARRLRHAYRAVIDKQLNEPENVIPNEALRRAKELFEDVTRTPEAVLDSTLVSLAASRGRQLVTALPINLRKFEPDEFAARVRDFVSDTSQTDPLTERAWAQIGKLAEGNVRASHPFWYLYGSAGEVPVKTRQAPVRRQPQEGPDRAPTVPKQVRSGEQTNQETTTERVAIIHELLRDLYQKMKRPLPYIELVLHPRSFAKTCENIFHLSFLINEGHARIKCDANNLLVVEPVYGNTSTEREANKSGGFTMTMNMQQWREAVKALNVTRPVIPG